MKINLFDADNWREIGTTLARNKTRTFLTGFGIFWGTAMLAILLGGSQGAKDLLMRNFAGFATNSAVMFSSTTTIPYKGQAKSRSWSMNLIDIERIRQQVPQLKIVTTAYNARGLSASHGRYSYLGSIQGVEPAYADVMAPTLFSGRFINDADVTAERKVAVIGKKVADQLFPGQPDPVGERFQLGNISYKIIGVIGQTTEVNINGSADESIYIPASVYRRVFNRGNNVDMVMMVANDGEKIVDLKDKLRHIIYQNHYIAPDDEPALVIFDISEEFEKVNNLFIGVSILALFIGLSTLLAGIIGVGNIMWVIVKERTQEIGIRRAIGAKPSDIIWQILSEGTVLTAVAGIAGIVFAAVALGITQALTANEISTPRFQMSLSTAIGIVLVFGVLGIAAGFIPARKAMKIKPVEALNDK